MTRVMKDSGVAWIGDIPQGWEIVRFKNMMSRKPKRNSPELPPGAISFGKVVEKDDDKITEDTKTTYQEVLEGEVLINPINLNYDLKSLRTALSDINVCVSSAYIVARVKTSVSNVWLKNLLYYFDVVYMKTLGAGVRQTITFDDIGNCLAVRPPLSEQLVIADYIDKQTALIDQRLTTLAEKKAVLAELRKATIHEAVTKGLNKTVTTSQWLTIRIKDVAKLNPSTLLPKLDEIDFFPMEAIGVDGGLTMGQHKAVSQAGGYSQMKNGDVCFAKVTPCFENGKSAICEGLASKVALATTEITVLRPNKRINLHFLHYRIKGWDFASGGANQMKGAGGLKRVPERFAADFVFQLPPLSEQLAIVKKLDQQTQQFDAQLATLDAQAQVLKELRKAIIHEAVTGKIDLSSYAPPQPQQAQAA